VDSQTHPLDPAGDGPPSPHVVVVGGGIAGLAAAHAVLSRVPAVRVTVLEGAARIGGKLRLGELAGQRVDLGAEAMHNRRPEAVDLARAVGLADSLVYPKSTAAGVWTRGAVRRLPRNVMGVPADLAGLAASGIVERPGVSRARLERTRPRLDVSQDVGIGALVAQRVGGEVRDRLVEPLLGGVYAGRADELSLHATVPSLVPAIAEYGSLLAAAEAITDQSAGAEAVPVFAGIDGGVGRLAGATEAAIRAAGGVIRCGATVREIIATGAGFRVVVGPTIAAETVEADAVIVAVPATAAARLLRDAAPRAASELSGIDYASMAIVTVALRASETVGDLQGSGFLVPPVDGRQIKAATYSTGKWGWLAGELVVIRCSIGRYGEERQLQHEDAELVQAALADLREAVGLRGPVVDTTVTRWGGALPQYTVGHLDRVRRVRDAVALVPGLAVCGAAYDGLGIPACIATGRLAATRVVDHLRPNETMQP
jgi:oxygen-dependent protoporphyrinogen oxidase